MHSTKKDLAFWPFDKKHWWYIFGKLPKGKKPSWFLLSKCPNAQPKCTWCLHACTYCSYFIGVYPWYLLNNCTKFHKNLKYRGLFTPPSCLQFYMHCACMRAPAWPQILIINSGDQFWHMLKVLWRSNFIWLRYWYGLPVKTFGNTCQKNATQN